MSFAIRLVVIIAVIFGLTVFADLESNRIVEKKHAALQEATKPKVTNAHAKIGNTPMVIEIADTEEARVRGLSGRTVLPPDHGMLFVFPQNGIYRFWMPEMHFPLDIIWIDEQKRVIGAAQNAEPIVDESNITLYQPPHPVRYALEVNAGFVKEHHVVLGSVLDIF